MGRLMGENNRKSSRSTTHKHRVIVKEINQEEQEPTFDGELPLFFPTNSKSSSCRDLKQVEVGWPLGRQEIAAWASSFRFELDGTDAERLQEVLDAAANHRSGRRLTESLPSGESFRFVSGIQSGHLKPPRQLEKPHHASSKQEEEAVPLSARRIKVVAYDVAASPRRSEILRRLSDLKAHPLSPTFAPEEVDAVSYHKEMAAVRDKLHGRLKTSLPLLNDFGSSSPGHGELEIISNLRERRRNSSSGLRASPRKPAKLGSPEHPITASSRFRNGDEQQPTTPTSRFRNYGDSQPTTPTSRFKHGEVQPITPTSRFGNGDEQPTTPTSRFSDLLDSRSAIQEQIVSIRKHPQGMMNSPSPEHTLSLPGAIPFKWEEEPGKPKTEVSRSTKLKDDENSGKIGSFRFYGRHSREGSLGRSSRRYSTQEPLIDLDASAAAKFLVFESPSRSPNLHSPRNFAVPFKWEATPGKSKVETVSRRSPGNLLQLPPRLAVPSYSASRELRGSHPFVGFFAPCITGSEISSPVHRKIQYTPSRSLPPKAPPARRHGLVGRCSSAPREGCQIRVSRSFDEKPGRQPGKLFISDSNGPSSPTSILCGPEESSTQTSASNTAFSSGEIKDFRQHSRQSTSKSSSSYESIEEEFTEPPPSDLQGTPNPASVLESSEQSSRRWKGRPDVVNSLLKPAAKLDHGPTRAPENSLSNYLQCLEIAASTSTSTEDVSLLQGASTSRSYPQQSSPRRATRLPYTMPSAAEQLLSSCSTSGRRQLIQDLSPRLLHQISGRRLSSEGNTPKTDRGKQEQQVTSPSPAYAASLELFSPAAAIVPQRRKWPVTPKRSPLVPPPKPRRRSRFMLSICRNLKRVLYRKRRRNNSPKEQPHLRLMYLHDGRSPTAQFRFSTTYT